MRPDGRAPRVKANLRREDPREEQPEPEERTLAPFVEQFFASPSSPKPFIFTVSSQYSPKLTKLTKTQNCHNQGSPEPRLRGADTLLTSAPEEEESFLPTIQPQTTMVATDLLPPKSREPGPSSFLAQPPSAVKPRTRFRGRNRVVVKSTVPSFAIEQEPTSDPISEEQNSLASLPTIPTKSKPRVKSNLRSRGKFGECLFPTAFLILPYSRTHPPQQPIQPPPQQPQNSLFPNDPLLCMKFTRF